MPKEAAIEDLARLLEPYWFETYEKDGIETCVLNNFPGQHLRYQEMARNTAREFVEKWFA